MAMDDLAFVLVMKVGSFLVKQMSCFIVIHVEIFVDGMCNVGVCMGYSGKGKI